MSQLHTLLSEFILVGDASLKLQSVLCYLAYDVESFPPAFPRFSGNFRFLSVLAQLDIMEFRHRYFEVNIIF